MKNDDRDHRVTAASLDICRNNIGRFDSRATTNQSHADTTGVVVPLFEERAKLLGEAFVFLAALEPDQLFEWVIAFRRSQEPALEEG